MSTGWQDKIQQEVKQQLFSPDIEEFCLDKRSVFYLKSDAQIADDIVSSLREIREREIALHIQDIAKVSSHFFGRSPLSVVPLSRQGTFHVLYRVIFSDTESYVVRTSNFVSPYHTFDFYIDRWAMNVLEREGLPALRIYDVDVSRKICSFYYEILEEAKGRSLAAFEINMRKNTHLLFELGKIIARLHGIAMQGFGLVDVRHLLNHQEGKGMLDSWKEYIYLNLDKHIETCIAKGAISVKEGAIIASIFERAQPILDCVPQSLLHGDLSNHNIFSDGERITALIDWEDCLSGDPVFDIASWGTFIGNAERRESFLEGYRSVRELPEDFEPRYWLYYLRVILAKTLHRYRFKYHYHDRIPASERIQQGLRKVECLI